MSGWFPLSQWGIYIGDPIREIFFALFNLLLITRMHFSGMRTSHLLTVSQHAGAGGCLPTGVFVCQGGCFPRGCLPRGCVYPSMQWGRHTPRGQTDTCENITFANFVCGRNNISLMLPCRTRHFWCHYMGNKMGMIIKINFFFLQKYSD